MDKEFRQRVRTRMLTTGESYETARAALLGKEPLPAVSDVTAREWEATWHEIGEQCKSGVHGSLLRRR